ncbi:class I SAM-dependent methyltransferase [Nocardioides sp. Soil796]|uniref:class I SAM-dependent methyltransferase n=1 Tax=Nocardioides sp. Soil796 TaxID=1736412 RepID=UPI00070E95C8|nr:class I SAM-dependent methyltransferase [Nocardioides sp. Soil796]KRF13118.1 hypothetical protein ASH02_16710 [Nocardioides sp. Soil796]
MTASPRRSRDLGIRRQVRRRLGSAARRLGVQRVQPAPPVPVVRTGMVEAFEPRWIEGWIAVSPGTPAVTVTLRVNRTDLVTTLVADPAKRRVPGAEVRRFRFRVKELWDYIGTHDRLAVVVDGRPLPIAAHGTVYRPRSNGPHRLQELKDKLAGDHVFSRSGALQVAKNLDTAWQRRTMTQAGRVRDFVSERFGLDAFFIYGTLLGAVRENGVIGHDSDIDLAYVSGHRNGADAARELHDIAFALIDSGFRVLAYGTHLRIANEIEGDKDAHVDLFHTYFDEHDVLGFPYGVSGVVDVRASDWTGVHEIDFAGSTGLLPNCAERVAEALYGTGWREPQPGFNWDRDRRTRAADALMPRAWTQQIYWADFYEHTGFLTPSPFFEAVSARGDVPRIVVDLGCGEGRDSVAHAEAGRRVFGIDRSQRGIRRAEAKAAELGLEDRLSFHECDVADTEALASVVGRARAEAGDEPVMFYLRFFLHSLEEETQDALLSSLDALSRPGDVLAAEFRTADDKANPKVHRHHYRRYQDGPAFGAALAQQHAFEVLEEQEGIGLSPYQDEDPHLYRVVARRSGGTS